MKDNSGRGSSMVSANSSTKNLITVTRVTGRRVKCMGRGKKRAQKEFTKEILSRV